MFIQWTILMLSTRVNYPCCDNCLKSYSFSFPVRLYLLHSLYTCSRSGGLLCTNWIFWPNTALLFPQQQRPQNGWLSELLLRMGHLGLLSCINGGMLCPCSCFCCHLCNSWCSLWLSCIHHGNSKDLAEALPHPHQEGAYKGKIVMLVEICRLKCFSYFLNHLILYLNLMHSDQTFFVVNIYRNTQQRIYKAVISHPSQTLNMKVA